MHEIYSVGNIMAFKTRRILAFVVYSNYNFAIRLLARTSEFYGVKHTNIYDLLTSDHLFWKKYKKSFKIKHLEHKKE